MMMTVLKRSASGVGTWKHTAAISSSENGDLRRFIIFFRLPPEQNSITICTRPPPPSGSLAPTHHL